MTIIEQRTMDAIQSINRKMRDQTEIDWEQRRFDIVKSLVLSGVGKYKFNGDVDKLIDFSIGIADKIIEKLKK